MKFTWEFFSDCHKSLKLSFMSGHTQSKSVLFKGSCTSIPKICFAKLANRRRGPVKYFFTCQSSWQWKEVENERSGLRWMWRLALLEPPYSSRCGQHFHHSDQNPCLPGFFFFPFNTEKHFFSKTKGQRISVLKYSCSGMRKQHW